LMCFAHVSLLPRCMPRYFTSFFWGRRTLPISTVEQVCCVGWIYFTCRRIFLILNKRPGCHILSISFYWKMKTGSTMRVSRNWKKNVIFRVVKQNNLIEVNRRFEGRYWLDLQVAK
jgi:hypothetical protein